MCSSRLGKAIVRLAAVVISAACILSMQGCSAYFYAIGHSVSDPAEYNDTDNHSFAEPSEHAYNAYSGRQTEQIPEEPEGTLPVEAPGNNAEALLSAAANEFCVLSDYDIGFWFDTSKPFAEEIASHSDQLLFLKDKYRASAEAALATAAARAAHDAGAELQETVLADELPSWQLAAALNWAFGRDTANRLLSSAVTAKMSIEGGVLTAVPTVADFDDIIAGEPTEGRFTADFVYSYYCTVYNDDFTIADYQMPEVTADYLSTLSLPLEKMLYYDSWYGPRQQSTRLHLGMDIHARKNTPIYSCTEGTVIAVGYDDTAGYYVVVEDQYGYEYHYYHMVSLTEYVKEGDAVVRGQQIGSVGCTGNSDGYHLHLSIIDPGHIHLNPYYVMCSVRDING